MRYATGMHAKIPIMRPLLLFTFGVTLLNGMTVKEFKARMADEKLQLMAGVYINGLGEGLIAANARMEQSVGVGLFCMPKDLALKTEDTVDVMNRQLKLMLSNGMTRERLDRFEIGSILLLGLENSYPCAGKK